MHNCKRFTHLPFANQLKVYKPGFHQRLRAGHLLPNHGMNNATKLSSCLSSCTYIQALHNQGRNPLPSFLHLLQFSYHDMMIVIGDGAHVSTRPCIRLLTPGVGRTICWTAGHGGAMDPGISVLILSLSTQHPCEGRPG